MRLPTVFVSLAFIALALSTVPPGASAHLIQISAPHVSEPGVVFDGTLSSREYAATFFDSDSNMLVSLQHSGGNLYIGLEAQGVGWIGIRLISSVAGLNYTNVIFGGVGPSGPYIEDAMFDGWEVHSDLLMGATDDVVAWSASEGGGNTTLEIEVPLNSGDPNDQMFEPGGTYWAVLAYNATSDDLADPDTAHSHPIALYIEPEPLPSVPTRISLEVSQILSMNEETELTAVLRTDAGKPVSGVLVIFVLKATFGSVELERSRTNLMGKAFGLYAPRGPGEVELIAAFTGAPGIAGSETSMRLSIQSSSLRSVPLVVYIGALVGVVVGPIWLTYCFVLYNLLRISKGGKEMSKGARGAGFPVAKKGDVVK